MAEYIASHPSTRSQENLDELLKASIPKVHECIGSLDEPHMSCLFSRRNDERHKWNTDVRHYVYSNGCTIFQVN